MLPGEVANGRFVEFSLPEIWFCGMGAHEKAHQPDWLESHGSLSRQPVFVPVRDQNGLIILDRDEYMRPGTTVEDLGKLKRSEERPCRERVSSPV